MNKRAAERKRKRETPTPDVSFVLDPNGCQIQGMVLVWGLFGPELRRLLTVDETLEWAKKRHGEPRRERG